MRMLSFQLGRAARLIAGGLVVTLVAGCASATPSAHPNDAESIRPPSEAPTLGQPSPTLAPSSTTVPTACPGAAVDLQAVAEVKPAARATCFGSRELTLRGWVFEPTDAVFDCVITGGDPPPWLLCATEHQLLTAEERPPGPLDDLAFMRVAADPDGPVGRIHLGDVSGPVPVNTWVEVTGHFNDPAAAACGALGADFRTDCAGTFVLTAVTVVGPDALAASKHLAVGMVAEVIVDSLNVRAAPGVGSPLAAPGETGRLSRGDQVYLADGPVAADGYDWYFVSATVPVFWQPMGCEDQSSCGFPALGWVAIGPADDPWLAPATSCPPEPVDELTLVSMAPLDRLACFSGQTLTITAQLTFGAGWLMPLAASYPPWIGSEASPMVLVHGRAVLPVRYPPEFGDCWPATGWSRCSLTDQENQTVELDLTIDEPTAATCVPVSDMTPVDVAVLRCRAQLVVTAVRVR